MSFRNDIKIDTGCDLWKTCIHEAGHVVMRLKYGWTIERVWIYSPNSGAVDYGPMPQRQWRRMSDREQMMAHGTACLAGQAAGLKLSWLWEPGGCGEDVKRAKDAAREGGLSLGEIKTNSRVEISRNWKAVVAEAEKLYVNSIERGIKRNSWF